MKAFTRKGTHPPKVSKQGKEGKGGGEKSRKGAKALAVSHGSKKLAHQSSIGGGAACLFSAKTQKKKRERKGGRKARLHIFPLDHLSGGKGGALFLLQISRKKKKKRPVEYP